MEIEEVEVIVSPDTNRNIRIPPGQHLTEKWPVLHYGRATKIDPAEWSLKIFGLVNNELTLNYKQFMALPMVKVISDIHCVTTWSKLNNLWEGVSTSELKNLVEINPQARFVIVHAANNFTANIPIEEFFETDVLFAVRHDSEDISSDHGGPVRLVVPRLYFWKSAKWVTGIEFTAEDRPGFWESAGYHNHGDPWKEERYSR
ncbi:MAG: sulfite oxidase-like oxidoreductase [Dehalococcoidales bacterium]|nr:sulfite oxidase-like oxidoreductase [Dehalococcoidales bacterium]